MALLAFFRHGDQRTLNGLAVNGFLLLLTLSQLTLGCVVLPIGSAGSSVASTSSSTFSNQLGRFTSIPNSVCWSLACG